MNDFKTHRGRLIPGVVRRGATRCWLPCYLALFFVAYITFIRSEPTTPVVHAQERARSASTSAPPTIRLTASADQPSRFEVHALSQTTLDQLAGEDALERQQALLMVSVAPADEETEPTPMLGTYRVEKGVLAFEPRFPLAPGVTYLARLNSIDSATKPIAERFTVPNPKPAEPTVVQQIFPTSSELPENQLKFYIYFSAPMSRGHAYRNIRLLKQDGQPVEGAFLEIDQELWDRDATRFMLLLDPGRVKRGLKPREEDGPVLEEGHRYTLVVDRSWPDATGFELSETFRKSFTVHAPDDVPLDTATWRIEPPAGDQGTLSVQFPEPIDRALLERVLWVETSGGRGVKGQVQIDLEETRWRFRPDQPWDPAESYVLAVERILEDRAGNRIGRKFEVDVFEKIDRQIESEVLRLPFRVGK